MSREEKIMQVMGYVDDDLIEEASGEVRRRNRLPRVLLAAACICLMMTGTVLAFEKLAGVHLMDFFRGERLSGSGVVMSGYRAVWEGTDYFAPDCFSEQAQSMAVDSPWEGTKVPFESWEAAEEFLGLELPGSEVMSKARKTLRYGVDESAVHCYVHLFGDEKGISEADVVAAYAIDATGGTEPVDITLEARAYTELSDEQQSNEAVYGYRGDEEMKPEVYSAAGGIEAVIVHTPAFGEREKYVAHFVLGGVRYQLSAECNASRQTVLDEVKLVLDGFAGEY